jgi:hypothetical protein
MHLIRLKLPGAFANFIGVSSSFLPPFTRTQTSKTHLSFSCLFLISLKQIVTFPLKFSKFSSKNQKKLLPVEICELNFYPLKCFLLTITTCYTFITTVCLLRLGSCTSATFLSDFDLLLIVFKQFLSSAARWENVTCAKVNRKLVFGCEARATIFPFGFCLLLNYRKTTSSGLYW